MNTHNGNPIIEVSTAGHGMRRTRGSILAVNVAVSEWEHGRKRGSTETWVNCFWDNVLRRSDQIRALTIV